MLRWGRARRHLSAARNAARGGVWPAAVEEYTAFLTLRPRNAAARVQLGHAQKALGDLVAARATYEHALALAPSVADTWLQLAGVLCRLGDRPGAIDCCVRAVTIDPGFHEAIDELLGLGGRDQLPGGISYHIAVGGHTNQVPWLKSLAETQHGDVHAPSRYAAYRTLLEVPAPPAAPGLGHPIAVVIDARAGLPVDVRATLSSLLDQTDAGWTATVLAPPTVRDHSVASLAAIDPRILFADPSAALPIAPYLLLVRAGTVLDRATIGWFGFTAAHTGCAAAYADHDHCSDDWRNGRCHDTPVFQPMWDPDWFADPAVCPALLLVDPRRCSVSLDAPQRILIEALGGVAHIPQLLSSIKRMSAQAANAQADFRPPLIEPLGTMQKAAVNDRIHVIVQTRDAPDLLREAIDSLRHYSTWPDRLDITIVDNRSVLPATARLLARYAARHIANILPLDEPFNWSRANNLAAAEGKAPILLFLNNDTTTLTQGWDGALHQALSDPGVGGVGAMLLYPDQSIQHAGMIFGIGSGGPMHEGVGHAGNEPGPTGRWGRARTAAAVTGAFLAVRRTVFDQIGGFDAVGLSIAFNDVDLCLRVREAGYRIVQTPVIRLVHHESKTRGFNVTRSQVAWDLEELAVVHRRWGGALFEDPAYNPHWTRIGQPFDGFRFTTLDETLRHIDRSAVSNPWLVASISDAGR